MMAYHPFRHLGLKVVSVAVALGLWFALAGEQTVERSLRVPLELRNRPERLELVDDPPATIEVRVRGASGLLSRLMPADVVGEVDLSTARPGRRFFTMTPAQVRAPFGVDVVDVTPGTISLRFEPTLVRRVPLVPVIDGDPADGYVVGPMSVTPASVEIAGPESAVLRLKETNTESISVSGARRSIRESVAIGLSDPSLRLTTPGNAEVTVQIQPMPVDRLLTQVPMRIRNAARGLSAEVVPAAVAVAARGPKEVIDSLRPDSIEAFVDLAGFGPGRYNLTVRVDPPVDVAVTRIEPATVHVRIR
jgi:YbbR domain-containing protein